MKNKIFLLVLLIAMLPQLAHTQNKKSEIKLNDYVAELNEKCPITFADGWTVNSFVAKDDNVTVEITVAPSIDAYIPYMAANGDQVKQMWLRQMQQYGPMWNTLIDLAVNNNHAVVITLKATSSDATASFTFHPSDFVKPL